MKIIRWSVLVLLAASTVAFAQNSPDDKERAMMEAFMKAATPGEAHKKLQPYVGSWNARVTLWMAPGAPPAESSGTAESRWIFDGRYIEQRFQGTFMGMPFTGLGYTGYDNIKKHYVSTWMDSMSTSLMMANGSADSTGRFMVFAGRMTDPLTGQTSDFEERIRVVSDDEHQFEMWGPAPDGKRFKMMEIVYTRR